MKKFVTSIAALTLAASLLAGTSASAVSREEAGTADPKIEKNGPSIPLEDILKNPSGDEQPTQPTTKPSLDENGVLKEKKTEEEEKVTPESLAGDKGAISGDKGAISGEQKEDKKDEKKADKPAAEKVLPKTSAVK